ncbi:hypothetical protein COCC4DRAFT_70767 [Bipolaris maydis ATCC 48331]|uniref:Cytochrome P450 monooxygenase n=2 Tax=Cochliobolus heterostrophus TaxID=5016 RepID=M2UHQ4_COCH5|nr:uncharacterized protein COCC4DRAFT_70767 [Bipolaris maydis ATCC 48331]EMD93211.1 hypothetical protein COCHEDRAFT_1192591 [Bipolaris maydis C5]KAJ5027553.1 cytochrome P450 [Bipolaris maydis]ENI07342.1 hypothetical protein COCC4DRAFT_70767 [Bipolaris maydis ATCC 48331]KAJ6204475.1 toxin biosynthesis cytochrome P450 monooxygenase [Bipolaris maydis]KAJ6266800.1 cytochrome P450 [Bipolaris maydis]
MWCFVTTWASYIIVAAFLYPFTLGCYNLFLHPLRPYPGPRIFAAFRFPYVIAGALGYLPQMVLEMHRRYGPVIRVAPDELAFDSTTAWRTIYDIQKGRSPLERDPHFLPPAAPGVKQYPSMGTANNSEHSKFRRLLGHAFSAQALQAQEHLVQRHVDLLIASLRSTSASSEKPQDLATWFLWSAFDIVGDLALGESFSCVENRTFHTWPETVMAGFEAGLLISAVRRYVPLTLAWRLVPASVLRKRADHFTMARSIVNNRMRKGADARPDFLSYIMRHSGDEEYFKGFVDSAEKVVPTAALIVMAGGHSISTLLTSTVYFLLRRPETMKRLVEEIRSSFTSAEEINYTTASARLPYMLAVFDEVLRLLPPVGFGIPRMVPQEGLVVDGQLVPSGTRVSVFHLAAARSPRNFHKPDEFLPERWLKEEKIQSMFDNDVQSASLPFSVGPRSCIGRNMAYLEMRLVLSQLLWNFDISLDPLAPDRLKAKIFIAPKRLPLPVYLTPVNQSS